MPPTSPPRWQFCGRPQHAGMPLLAAPRCGPRQCGPDSAMVCPWP
jgi:hypothetical protein